MKRNYALFLAILILAGCGGEAGVASAPPSEISAGSFRVTGQMKAPLVAAGTSATVYALSGAITKATMSDLNPTIEETEIIFGRLGAGSVYSLVGCSPDGSNVRTIHATTGLPTQIFATTGWIYFRTLGGELRRVALAGSSTSTLLKSGVGSFALTPDGTKIVFNQGSVFKFANADGSAENTMITDASGHEFVGCPDNANAYTSHPGGVYRIAIQAASSFNLTRVVAGRPQVAVDSFNRRLYTHYANSLTKLAIGADSVTFTESATTTGNVAGLACSPDGKSLASYSPNAVATDSIFTCSSNPAQFSRNMIAQEYALSNPAWTPYIISRQFVPANVYTTGAAALLFSEFGKRMPAIVLADCTTRASMVVTKPVSDNLSNVIYRLDCDELSKLHYTRANSYSFNSIVTSATGLKGCFVSFDAESGELASVLTFTRAPVTRATKTSLVVSGEGLAFYELRGKFAAVPKTGSEFSLR